MTVTHRKYGARRRPRLATAGGSPPQAGAPAPASHDTSAPAVEPVTTHPETHTQPHTESGAWRPGDPVGRREFADIGDLELERGGLLSDVRIAYETWGRLNEAGDNVVLVEHALTGDSHVVGEAGPGHPSPGWWSSLIGSDRPVDPDDWFVVASNVLGGCQGSTGPSSAAPDGQPWGSRFPYITIRDQVRAERLLLDRLGIKRLAAVVGGSMGGMRAIEWAVGHPADVDRCIVLASTARATADQIAWCQPQLLAIRNDPDFAGGDYYTTGRRPDTGLGLARRIAHITYRTETELDARFGRTPQLGEDPLQAGHRGRFAVESYLDHHAGKLARRFDANSYLVLTEAMNSHDVGRDRGGLYAALSQVTADCTIVSVDTDRLYPPRLSDQLHAGLRVSRRAHITSDYGHDGFLIEEDQVGRIVRGALDRG
jgi:homoserine O-acetyltransferase